MNKGLIIILFFFLASFQGMQVFQVDILELQIPRDIPDVEYQGYKQFHWPSVVMMSCAAIFNFICALFLLLYNKDINVSNTKEKVAYIGIPFIVNSASFAALSRITFIMC